MNNSGPLSTYLLKFRCKLSRFSNLLPTPQKRTLSVFEDKHIRTIYLKQLWKQSAENLGFKFEDLGYGYWSIADTSGKTVKGNIHGIELDSNIAVSFAGNKPLTHHFLEDIQGYISPDFCVYTLDSIHKAIDFLSSSSCSCVVKPAQGTGAGAGVTTGIADISSMKAASIAASMFSHRLVIEKTIDGDSYRLLILNSELIHTVRRDPPVVVGDGKSTIKQLIREENIRRLNSQSVVALSPIQIDQECKKSLKSASRSLRTIPKNNEAVIVKHVINQNSSEQNVEITGGIHPSIIQTAIDATKRIGLHLSGVDVLTTDISKPLQETGGVINEINSNPGIHHHYLINSSEQPEVRIAEKIITYCMSSKPVI